MDRRSKSDFLTHGTLAQAAIQVCALTSEFCSVDWALLPLSTSNERLQGIQHCQGEIPLPKVLVLGLEPSCGLPVQ